jgi:hypothetical protein
MYTSFNLMACGLNWWDFLYLYPKVGDEDYGQQRGSVT